MKTIALLLSAALLFTACQAQKVSERTPASAPTLASFSERFERSLENESELVQRIRSGILFLQASQAKQSGKVLRGTHAKGVCVAGEFEVSDLSQLPSSTASRLRKGIFSNPGRYTAQLRFANAEGKILPDSEPDVRAVSFSIKVPSANEQGLMDFAMNTAPTFPINDAKVFADLMTVAEKGLIKGGFLIGISGIMAVKNAMSLGGAQKKPASEPFQKMRYWSTVPFALGADEAVKYSLKPCEQNSAQALKHDPNALSLELLRHVSNDSPSCFDFQVQPLEAAKMKDPKGKARSEQDWVENATLEWPESQAPFYTVGRIHLRRGSAVDQATCESWKINAIANANQTHRGLGSINRARSQAETASAEQRAKNP